MIEAGPPYQKLLNGYLNFFEHRPPRALRRGQRIMAIGESGRLTS